MKFESTRRSTEALLLKSASRARRAFADFTSLATFLLQHSNSFDLVTHGTQNSLSVCEGGDEHGA